MNYPFGSKKFKKRYLILLLCSSVITNYALAAQQPLNAVPKSTASNAITVVRDGINTELTKQQTMNTELYAADLLKADKSCFADAFAFNACFGLDWPTGGSFDQAGNYTLTGSWDFSGATVTGVSGAALPTWMPSVGPTNGRQILQATGGCTLSAYDNQADCQTNSGIWTTPTYQHTSVISGLINDTGTANDDLWSAAKITSELSGKQASLGYTPENTANKGTANGYAGLGSDGKVPSSQLPTLGTTYDLPSLADAQAGTSTTPYVWSPQRVAQAIVALAPSGGAAEGYYEIDGGSAVSITFTGDIDGGASI